MEITAKSKTAIKPQSLPPTERVIYYHSLRVYLQVIHDHWEAMMPTNADPLECIVSSRVLNPHEKWTPLTEKTSPVCNIQVGGNSYYHSLFPNKNMAHLLTYSLTYSLTHSHPLTGQVDLSTVKQTDVKSHQLVLEIYQVVYLLYL